MEIYLFLKQRKNGLKNLKTNKIMEKDEFWKGFFLGILVTIEFIVIIIMI
jgi:hypothetical protein